MTTPCPTCHRPPADPARPATLGPGQSCACGIGQSAAPPAKWTAGQDVWVVRTQRWCAGQKLMPLLSAGRKWGHISGVGRFDLKTGIIDGAGYSSVGRVYPSREAWIASERSMHVWCRFEKAVRDTRKIPAGVTPDDILRAAALLRLDVEDFR